MKMLNKLTLLAIVWSLPLLLGQLDVNISFGETATAQEKKKQERKKGRNKRRTQKNMRN